MSEYDDYYVVNVYVPNSGEKLARLDYRVGEEEGWDATLCRFVQALQQVSVCARVRLHVCACDAHELVRVRVCMCVCACVSFSVGHTPCTILMICRMIRVSYVWRCRGRVSYVTDSFNQYFSIHRYIVP